MGNTQLQTKLDDLILLASETVRINESSRQNLYKTLAQTYVTWKELQQDQLWLESQYRKADISFRSTGNEINFRPFIRLVFGVSEIDSYYRHKIFHWQAVLRKLDEFYTNDQRRFKTNTVNRLAGLIDELGGITTIVNDGKQITDENNEKSDDRNSQIKKKKTLEITKAELSKRSVSDFANSEASIGALKLKGAIRSDENNLVALIARREENGTLTVLGSTNNSEAINEVAIGARAQSFTESAQSLVQLAECISTQMFPHGSMPSSKAAQKVWKQRIYYDRSDFKADFRDKKTGEEIKSKIPNPRRLLLRGKTGDILFSSKHSDVGVVTKCTPHNFLIPKTTNVYLKTEERSRIEEWLCDNTIWLMNAQPENKLNKATNQKYIYSLKIVNSATGKDSNLHFYEQGRAQDIEALSTQTDFDYKSYEPIWITELDAQWFVNLRANFLDDWFRKLGKNTQLNRENNFKFIFEIKSKGLSIRYDIDATGDAPVRHFQIFSDLPARNTFGFEVRAKDMAPVLYNLANIGVLGKIYLSGNENAVVIEFDTNVGHYTIAIPTLAERKLAQGKNTSPKLFFRTN